MNKIIILILFTVFVNAGYGQEQHKGFSRERFKKELEQFIIKDARLTPKKIAHFFPLYHEMKDKQRNIHERIMKLKRTKPATDAECKKNIAEQDKLNMEMMELQKEYHGKFLKVLTPGTLYDVIKAEDKFHRQAYKRVAKRQVRGNKH